VARILVIDDDPAVRLSAKLALEDAGHRVEEAVNGEEGLKRMRANPADLVISDIFMPEKEGLETIDEIRRNHPQTRIIAISGGGRMDPADYLEIAERVGADRSLSKPFDILQLLDVVKTLLEPEGNG
jgi:CheY-like chemotaxis protein